jgi:hypothetical protein
VALALKNAAVTTASRVLRCGGVLVPVFVKNAALLTAGWTGWLSGDGASDGLERASGVDSLMKLASHLAAVRPG